MISEFKKFLLRGNVIDLSTGVLIGLAFGKIVDAFTKGIVEPMLKMVGGGGNVALMAGPFDIGVIISAIIQFVITAAVIFFVIIKPANFLMTKMKREEAAAPMPGPTPTELLLAEIRDSLKK